MEAALGRGGRVEVGLDVLELDVGEDVVGEAGVDAGEGEDGVEEAAVGRALEVEEGGGLVVGAVLGEAAYLVVLGQVEVDLEEGGREVAVLTV